MKPRSPRNVWLDHVRDHVRTGDISSNASHIAHILATHYINGGLEAWPSQAELAASSGRSIKTVWRALDELEQHNLLERRPGQNVNVYKILSRSL